MFQHLTQKILACKQIMFQHPTQKILTCKQIMLQHPIQKILTSTIYKNISCKKTDIFMSCYQKIKKAVSAVIVMREKSLTQITMTWLLVNSTTGYKIINILNLS